MVFELERVAVQAAGGLNELAAHSNRRCVGRNILSLPQAGRLKKMSRQRGGLVRREGKIGHAIPAIMRLRIPQKRRQRIGLAKLPPHLAKRYLALRRRLISARVACGAVELREQFLARLGACHIDFFAERVVTGFERTEKRGDGLGFGGRSVQQRRHRRLRPELGRVENPLGHPACVPPRADAVERRGVHRQFPHAPRGDAGGVARKTTMLGGELAAVPQRCTLGQAVARRMLQKLGRNRLVGVVRRGPVKPKKRIASGRRSVSRLQRVAAGVEPDASGRVGRSPIGCRLQNDRAVEFKFEAAVQLGLKNEPVAEIELDDALPLGGERARRNERRRSLAKRNVEHEMRAHRRVRLAAVLRLESDRQPVEQHRLGLGGGYTGAWPNGGQR